MTEDMIDWVYDLRHFGIKLGLDNIRGLLEELEHPEQSYRIVHVAGTNGKGSVGAMIEAILGAHDLRVGLFTSPHLVRPHERIRLAGADIADDELQRQLRRMRGRIEAAIGRGLLAHHPSFFEVMTACALLTFREQEMDAAVLEVGLGGRLDATNAVEPDVCVVVSIDLDHTKTLGGTLELIAAEKAGIVKSGRPVISGVTQQRALDVLRATCRERGAEFVDGRQAVRFVDEGPAGYTLESRRSRYPGLELALPGRHQLDNSRIALAACEELFERMDQELDPEKVRRGLKAVRWAGRLQRVPARRGFPPLLLDAAHNPAGMNTLVAYLATVKEPPRAVVFGVTSGKPFDRLLEALSNWIGSAVITLPPVDRGIDAFEIGQLAEKQFDEVVVETDPETALLRAGELAGPGGEVLVTGSLYLVGHVLALLDGDVRSRPIAM